MPEISRQDRDLALAELERIERTLSGMSAWVDGDAPDQERASIMLEDAAKAVMAAGWLIERKRDPVRVSELVHRRMSRN